MSSETERTSEPTDITIRIPWYVVAAAVCGFGVGVLSNHYAIDWPSLALGIVIAVVVLIVYITAD